MSNGKSVDAEWYEGLNSDARDTVRITMLRQNDIDELVGRIKLLITELGNDNVLLGKVKMLYGWLVNKTEQATFGILTMEIERLEKMIKEARSR